MSGYLKTYADPGMALQATFDVAVVMPSLLRPEIGDALRSIFRQDLDGRIQILIGVDRPGPDAIDDLSRLDAICAERPQHCVVQAFYPGYSTSVRHGGLTPARDGGALRCILSYLANSPNLAYLDDDNWWRPDHLRLLLGAMRDADWAFSLRWYVHPQSRRPVCVDVWESVGPGRGVFAESYGGFVDPNCLMLNKVTCQSVLANWARPAAGDPKGQSADRNVFHALHRNFRAASTGEATAFYRLDPADDLHAQRVEAAGAAYHEAGLLWVAKIGS